MVTISLIAILVSVLAYALNSARTSAMAADTTSRLTSLKMATILFRNDIGYLPAVLDMNRNMTPLPEFPNLNSGTPQTMYRYLNQTWFSITSPAEFFLGYGNRDEDGFGRLPDSTQSDPDFDEMPRFGIRHPSMDGVWRATDIYAMTGLGLLTDRQPSNRGKLYGPYLEIENDQMYGRLAFDGVDPKVDPVTGQIKIFYPGDPDYDINQPMVIVDSWGSPIRYYRPIYPSPTDPDSPETGISRVFPQSSVYNRPMLSDFFVLRPFDFNPDRVIDGTLPDFRNGVDVDTGDTSTTIELQAGQFAYFSTGPDSRSNDYIRADVLGIEGNAGNDATDEVNADNIVEIGP
jgi:type II secretory pathway pseudopilin PulG